jgi:hypothetical protein
MALTTTNDQMAAKLQFLETGRFNDFGIKLPNFTFKVSKIEISSMSKYFEVACSKNFLVSFGHHCCRQVMLISYRKVNKATSSFQMMKNLR